MSATVDTSIFSEYFSNCPVLEVHGRTHPVQGNINVWSLFIQSFFFQIISEYFLEDCIEMLKFVPPPRISKRKDKKNDDDDDILPNDNVRSDNKSSTLTQILSVTT